MTNPTPFICPRDQTSRARDLRKQSSKTERRLWRHLARSQLGAPFRRQYPIHPWFADYCCLPLKLVVEVDGPTHDSDHDAMRDASMRRSGFDVLRFSVQEIDTNLAGVVQTIWHEVQLRLQRQQHAPDTPTAARPPS